VLRKLSVLECITSKDYELVCNSQPMVLLE